MSINEQQPAAPVLPFSQFLEVVERTPLVSIDLIISNAEDEVLLGLRRNQPAAGFWFVPGGRILKNETLDAAFLRLTQAELGVAIPRSAAQQQGVYEHFYSTNAGLVEGFGTHYVVLAYQLRLTPEELQLPLGDQHQKYRWQAKSAILEDDSVNKHTKDYFRT